VKKSPWFDSRHGAVKRGSINVDAQDRRCEPGSVRGSRILAPVQRIAARPRIAVWDPPGMPAVSTACHARLTSLWRGDSCRMEILAVDLGGARPIACRPFLRRPGIAHGWP